MAVIGDIIDGKYEVIKEIGRGGMSVVFLAMDKRLNKQWAIKEFRKDKDDANKQVALKALLDEANLMKKLDHPTLPRIVDIIENPDNVYVIMDYIEGESLNKVLDMYGAQPQEAVIDWAKQLSNVLDYLHTQNPPIIYRDMKPANIMLKPDGTVRLIDFGIAREYKEGKQGDTEVMGTRGYAAPEQFGGKGQTDARTDIYSLGVTLYHLVTGQNPAEPPYEIYPIRHWNATLSSGLEWIIQKCTQLNPGDRYQSCAELTYVLENIDKFDGEYVKARRSRLNLFIATVVASVVFILGGVGFLIGQKQYTKQTFEQYLSAGAEGDYYSYDKAIEIYNDEGNANRAKAYLELAEKLSTNVTSIVADSTGSAKSSMTTVYTKDILDWFSQLDLIKDNEECVDEYVQVCYRLGKIYWDCYSEDYKKEQARDYFQKALNALGENGNSAGYLSQTKYDILRIYYLNSFFNTKLNGFKPSDDADEDSSNTLDIQVYYACKDLGTIDVQLSSGGTSCSTDNMYYAYWQVMNSLVDLVSTSESEDMNVVSKINALSLIVKNDSHIGNLKTQASGYITDQDVKSFLSKLSSAISSLSGDVKTYNNVNVTDSYDELKSSFSNYEKLMKSTFEID